MINCSQLQEDPSEMCILFTVYVISDRQIQYKKFFFKKYVNSRKVGEKVKTEKFRHRLKTLTLRNVSNPQNKSICLKVLKRTLMAQNTLNHNSVFSNLIFFFYVSTATSQAENIFN